MTVLAGVLDLIIQLPISDPLSAGEYIRCDDNAEYEEEASVKDIADVVRGVGAGDESDSELKEEVSISNAIECITTLVDFINQNDFEIDASCIYSLNRLKREIVLKKLMQKKQTNLDHFLVFDY
ncbi:9575_t:CDS:2 [Paraglomus occultum]|uniref:9575_t:CDS:1 n=1 Tax=Paraglomus occultum TaxID=144539 RepID=A0A9N9G2V8_9GLOM|nr:9575_t:CDS:2 [Paraglomus occultum]